MNLLVRASAGFTVRSRECFTRQRMVAAGKGEVTGKETMDWASHDVIVVLRFLLPGFIAAAVFYSLTSHPRPGAFNQVVLALIFTVIGQAISQVLLDTYPQFLDWDLALTVLAAIVLGLAAAMVSNTDFVHGILRRLKITKETSYPSEWYSSFSRHCDCYVVLHLKGERRLYGWPEEWPSHPDHGHFRVSEAEWLPHSEEQRNPVTAVSAILVPVGEVEMVEFLERLDASSSE